MAANASALGDREERAELLIIHLKLGSNVYSFQLRRP